MNLASNSVVLNNEGQYREHHVNIIKWLLEKNSEFDIGKNPNGLSASKIRTLKNV